MTATAVRGTGNPPGHEQKDRVRVVIADDSVLLREGIARLLDESGFEVVGQASDAEELLRKVGAHKPDIAVVDVRMPPTHTDEGLRAAHRIRAEHPGTAVLVLSQYVEEAYALDLLSRVDRAHRLSAQGPRRRRGDLHRRRAASGRGRLGARSRGRGAAARPPPARGPARRAHTARARGARPDGRGALQFRDGGRAGASANAPSRSTSPRSSPSSTCRPRRRTIDACSPSWGSCAPRSSPPSSVAVLAQPARPQGLRPGGVA